MSGLGFLAVGAGATIGAWLRWALDILLGALFPAISPGTVAANLIGAYVIGIAMAFFADASAIAPEWRLLLVTGFCGGLTTFSAFSAEISALALQGRFGLMAGAVTIHVGGSLLMTLLGISTAGWLLTK